MRQGVRHLTVSDPAFRTQHLSATSVAQRRLQAKLLPEDHVPHRVDRVAGLRVRGRGVALYAALLARPEDHPVVRLTIEDRARTALRIAQVTLGGARWERASLPC